MFCSKNAVVFNCCHDVALFVVHFESGNFDVDGILPIGDCFAIVTDKSLYCQNYHNSVSNAVVHG